MTMETPCWFPRSLLALRQALGHQAAPWGGRSQRLRRIGAEEGGQRRQGRQLLRQLRLPAAGLEDGEFTQETSRK